MPLPEPQALLPETGEYQGKPINLGVATATLSQDELAQVVVDVPGRGKVRPWRFAQGSDSVVVRDGAVEIG
jgi:hypothetical protein